MALFNKKKDDKKKAEVKPAVEPAVKPGDMSTSGDKNDRPVILSSDVDDSAPLQNGQVLGLILEKLKELNENLTGRIDEVEKKVASIEKKMNEGGSDATLKSDVEELKKNMEMFSVAFEVISNQYNPFVDKEGDIPGNTSKQKRHATEFTSEMPATDIPGKAVDTGVRVDVVDHIGQPMSEDNIIKVKKGDKVEKIIIEDSLDLIEKKDAQKGTKRSIKKSTAGTKKAVKKAVKKATKKGTKEDVKIGANKKDSKEDIKKGDRKDIKNSTGKNGPKGGKKSEKRSNAKHMKKKASTKKGEEKKNRTKSRKKGVLKLDEVLDIGGKNGPRKVRRSVDIDTNDGAEVQRAIKEMTTINDDMKEEIISSLILDKKNEASKKFMKKAKGDLRFFSAAHNPMTNLYDLVVAINNDPTLFSSHVGPRKDHLADWIEKSLKMKALANKLRHIKQKDEYLVAILSYV